MYIFEFLIAAALGASSPGTDPKADIMAANARFTQAVARKDMPAVESIVAPGFRLTSGLSKPDDVTPRERWMANLQKMQIASYKTEITDLEIHGDSALATVEGSWDVSFGEFKTKDAFRLLDLWVRGPTGWQVVRRHITSPE